MGLPTLARAILTIACGHSLPSKEQNYSKSRGQFTNNTCLRNIFSRSQKPRHSGIALTNILRRLNLLFSPSHRWLKISKAMGGTRTPRQVASRVQKYNLKLKKWGAFFFSFRLTYDISHESNICRTWMMLNPRPIYSEIIRA
jgi:hypothetical protein